MPKQSQGRRGRPAGPSSQKDRDTLKRAADLLLVNPQMGYTMALREARVDESQIPRLARHLSKYEEELLAAARERAAPATNAAARRKASLTPPVLPAMLRKFWLNQKEIAAIQSVAKMNDFGSLARQVLQMHEKSKGFAAIDWRVIERHRALAEKLGLWAPAKRSV